MVCLCTSVVVMNWVRRCNSAKKEGCSDAHGCSISSLATACKHINTKLSLILAKFQMHVKTRMQWRRVRHLIATEKKLCERLQRFRQKKLQLVWGHRMCPFETRGYMSENKRNRENFLNLGCWKWSLSQNIQQPCLVTMETLD